MFCVSVQQIEYLAVVVDPGLGEVQNGLDKLKLLPLLNHVHEVDISEKRSYQLFLHF